MSLAALRVEVERSTRLLKGAGDHVRSVPAPRNLLESLSALGEWSGIPAIEAIVEAPVLNGMTWPLPNYGNAYMWGAYGATTSNGQWFGYSQRSNVNYTMVNGSTG